MQRSNSFAASYVDRADMLMQLAQQGWKVNPGHQEPICEHNFVEGVDENGRLVEPPYDVCVNCELVRH